MLGHIGCLGNELNAEIEGASMLGVVKNDDLECSKLFESELNVVAWFKNKVKDNKSGLKHRWKQLNELEIFEGKRKLVLYGLLIVMIVLVCYFSACLSWFCCKKAKNCCDCNASKLTDGYQRIDDLELARRHRSREVSNAVTESTSLLL